MRIPSREALLSELDKLNHGARIKRVALLGRDGRDLPELKSLMSRLLSGGAHEGLLALEMARAARDGDILLRGLTHPSCRSRAGPPPSPDASPWTTPPSNGACPSWPPSSAAASSRAWPTTDGARSPRGSSPSSAPVMEPRKPRSSCPRSTRPRCTACSPSSPTRSTSGAHSCTRCRTRCSPSSATPSPRPPVSSASPSSSATTCRSRS
ncbi:hypothetical protein ACN28S_04045 [Cystobacter fuscus]